MFHIRPYFRCFITFPPYFGKIIISPLLFKFSSDLVKCTCFTYFSCFSFPPSLTMMHLCITQCTYWTPLGRSGVEVNGSPMALNCRGQKIASSMAFHRRKAMGLEGTVPPKFEVGSRPMHPTVPNIFRSTVIGCEAKEL